ncbi:MAG TPA: EGF domain-containing protein [Kofleriaceae bacterium]
MRHLRFALITLLAVTSNAVADTAPQTLPFTQNWTNTGLITANDDWSGVPGITGFLGQDASTTTGGIDPQTVVTESTVANDLTVLANQGTATSTAGEVAEMEITDPTIALQGSGTADAPYVLITLNTTGITSVRVSYNLRDIDAAADNAIQPVALQYRVGTTGMFTNVPAAYVADATTGPSLATLVTPVSVVLPTDAGNQATMQIRIITGNAVGSDEWVGIDDISITNATTSPTAVGMASPASALRGAGVTLTAAVTPGAVPASTGLNVTCDISSIGGSATAALLDDGMNGDALAGDNIFTLATTVGATSTLGAKTFACTVADAETRNSTFNIMFEVIAVCGDGIVEGAETCDDSGTTAGDGCSATCIIETGYTCTGMPSVCTDIDECTLMTDNCDANAMCANTPGSFTCTCNTGYMGNGVTCADIDECTDGTDNCDANAMCANTAGSFTCTCNTGYNGNGVTCTDNDECNAGTDNCDMNAACTNTAGSFTCACNAGYSGNGTSCMADCGNGMIHVPEGCDDGNVTAGDGCTPNCMVEAGFTCTSTPSACSATCGDGMVVFGETCDDSNTTGNDGCNSSCDVEEGWTCTGTPSDCEPPPEDGGCCSSSTHPGSVALLMLCVFAGLRRRRRG